MATIGIDFGTSTTLIAIRQGDSPSRVLKLGKTTNWMPSVVALSAKGKFVCGEVALDQDFDRQIHSVKSDIGAGVSKLERNGVEVETSEIAELILREMIERSAKAGVDLTSKEHKVFVACPAGWGKGPRTTLADIYSSLGLKINVSDFIDEPIAVGFDWREQRRLRTGTAPQGKTLVFDAGGGTLDISLIDLKEGPEVHKILDEEIVDEFLVLTAEMLQLAGDAVDKEIARFIVEHRGAQLGSDIVTTEVLSAARSAKEVLSSVSTTRVAFPRRRIEELELSRDDLARLTEGIARNYELLAKRSSRGGEIRLNPANSPITIRQRDWGEVAQSIRYIALAGGTSQSSWVSELLKRSFPDSEIETVSSPQESVARGLTFVDGIQSLNLPRPPLDLIAEITGVRGTTRVVLHEAFENLYHSTWAIAGEAFLGHSGTVGSAGDDVKIFFASPDRRATPVKVIGGPYKGPVRFKLYATGDVFIKGSTSVFFGRVDGWPRPDGAAELTITPITNPSQIVEDWYRHAASK